MVSQCFDSSGLCRRFVIVSGKMSPVEILQLKPVLLLDYQGTLINRKLIDSQK